MKVITPHHETGWIECIIAGHWVQAKVYDKPSSYGINNGRVSKLAIGKTGKRDPNAHFHKQMCYNYDRGLDFDRAPKGLVAKVVAELEKLPKLFEKDQP